MNVVVASGKGGTGKTTVCASLARVWDGPVLAVDLDVEEPNLHLFLQPEMRSVEEVGLEVPVPDLAKCTLCRACSDLCQFKAVVVMGRMLQVFPEMCHGCGGCLVVCPEGALAAGKRLLGTLETGRAGDIDFLMGRLRVGEAMSPPLMKAVKARMRGIVSGSGRADALVDAPPGVSCPAVTAVMDADVVVLVTEPTPFGFHDFKLAFEAFSPLARSMGVVVNRAGLGDDSVQRFCGEKGLKILAEIPYDRRIAEAYSQGRVVAEADAAWRGMFEDLRDRVKALADGGAQ